VMGLDLNGDGDLLDTVRFFTPNNTNTYRLGVTSSLIWEINEMHRVRVAYTWDRARHRQTAEWGPVDEFGNPENVFAGRRGARVATADGSFLRGRDRYSIAELKQFAGEYRGSFADERFVATLGLRVPKFERELNQYCYTQNGGTGNTGQVLCTTQVPLQTLANGNVIFTPIPADPMAPQPVQYIPPYSTALKFDDVLPNVGLVWKPRANHMLYLSYAEGLSAPRTDNLYAVRRLADNSIGRGIPESEQTESYDLGWRYNSPDLLASVALWKTDYSNRIVSSFNPELGFNVDRNVGAVKLRGFDAQLGWRANGVITVSASASYNDSELQQDVQTG
ncbi:MAG: TonB-dependent receptor, partial [Steroidobacteraceae bacterium]|nr:TonB-dependent receptor [Steroidobacteraceae bacterium]